MRFVAGKGAVAELLLAWRRSGAVASRGAVAERHREEACQGTVAAEMLLAGRCWPGAVAERHREAAVGRGRYSGAVAGLGIAAEHCPSVNEIFYPFACHQFTFFLNFAAVSALRL